VRPIRITSSNLHLCIVSAVSATVAGTAVICVTRSPLTPSGFAGTQRVDDDVHDLGDEHADIVWRVLMAPGRDADVIRSSRASEALPRWRSLLPDSHVVPGSSDLLFLQLREGDQPLGVIGAARCASEKPFNQDDRERLESIGGAVSNMIALQQKCDELQRREVVTRAIQGIAGAYCVVDEDRRRMVWASSMGDAIPEDEIWAHERQIVEIVERSSRPAAANAPTHPYPSLAFGHVVKVVDLGAQPIFGSERCSAIALAAPGAFGALSPREMQIARLLLAGYTTINAAAILSVSENTVRTYVRRLYRKLNVVSRADLARECASNYGLVMSKDDVECPVEGKPELHVGHTSRLAAGI
jgi:DNA-binding CsgD family transcriptional regulator